MASTCDLTAEQLSDGIADQIPQLQQTTVTYNALNNPYANVVDGGIFDNNQGDTVRTLVGSRTVTGHSLVAPVFTATKNSCLSEPPIAQYGQTEFTAQLESLKGEGPPICLNQSRFSVARAYAMQEQALSRDISAINAADIRYQMLYLSGVKFVAQVGGSLDTLLTGGYNQVGVNFVGGVPTAPMTFQALTAISDIARDTLSPELFGDGAMQHFIGIFSSSQVRRFRNEVGVRADLIAATGGSFTDAKNTLFKYNFIDLPYQGIKLGIDQQPLRFNEVDGDGFPVFIEPLVETATDYGVYNAVNPAWSSALYEVGFLVSKGTFNRLVPKQYTGEGTMKFDPQFSTGKLEWFYSKDSCNKFGEIGNHIYRIDRAFQPLRPHGVIPILHTRCLADLGFEACDNYSSSGGEEEIVLN